MLNIEGTINFGHGNITSPLEIELLTKGSITVNGIDYTIQTLDIMEIFTDTSMLPTYTMTVEINNHPNVGKGNYLAVGTLQQCCNYILSL